jgi:Zn-dependent membrane protease YugP
MQLQNGMSGAEIAENWLIMEFVMRVISVAGQLTDHYNPVNKTVNLSEAVQSKECRFGSCGSS